MATLNPLAFGKVVGRFLANISDGPDIDKLPEFLPLSGTVTFKAAPSKILVAEGEPDPATVVQLAEHYVASLDQFGYLTWRNQRGVMLIAPDGNTNPTGWTWQVSFDLSYDGVRVPMASYSFEVPEYVPGPDPENPDEGSSGLVDLALVSPVPASNGEAVVRGLSVVDVDLVGLALVFRLDNGTSLDPVEIPQIQAAQDAATAAANSEEAAETAKAQAENIVNSFDLAVGTVTTGAPGDPASIAITGGPAYVLSAVIPQGDQGDPGPPVAPNSITSAEIAPDAVTADELADGAVDTAAIADQAVTAGKIANDTITAAQIATGAIGATELGDDAVDTAAIVDQAVTAAKIAANTITAAQIADNAIGAGELANGAVDTAAIGDGQVTSAKIADGTIVNADIATGAAIALTKMAAGIMAFQKNGTPTSVTVWSGTEAQYTALIATQPGGVEQPDWIYLRGA